MQTKSKWVQAIEQFEDALAKPMIPSLKPITDKFKAWWQSIEIRSRILMALGVLLLLLYMMMGAWGLVTFLLGITSVIILQVIGAFVYISYEHRRADIYAQQKREEEIQTAELMAKLIHQSRVKNEKTDRASF